MLQRRGIVVIARVATIPATSITCSCRSSSLRKLATMAGDGSSRSVSAKSLASSRVDMVTRHMTRSAQIAAAETNAKAADPVTDANSPVQASSLHGARIITLNRPKALNALSLEMIQLIHPMLQRWEDSNTCNIIILKGEGRALCAGGDVAALVKAAKKPETRSQSTDFFKQEYEMDRFIAHMKTPLVSFMDGVTMGGGVGLSVHAPFRIATEKTVFAMPETNIGLFPDVGANFFLPRLDGQLGLYLGLTSEQLRGYGVYQAGIATHFVPSDRLPALEERLASLQFSAEAPSSSSKGIRLINAAIEEFVGDANELQASQYDLIGAKRIALDSCFSANRAEEIVQALSKLEEDAAQLATSKEPGQHTGLASWAKKTRQTIEQRSPTSVKVALEGIRRGEKLNIDEVFDLDMHLATKFCNPDIAPDFVTGVEHVLGPNKAKANADGVVPRAEWSPSILSDLTTTQIRQTFFQPSQDESVIRLTKLPEETTSYKSYPHAFLALPSEDQIGKVVKGDTADAGSFAPTKDDVHAWFEREWKGKIGVREKVEEVLARRTSTDSGGQLKWISRTPKK